MVRFLWCHCKCCQLQLKWNYRMILEVEQHIYYLICLDLRQQRMQNMLALVFWELFYNCVLVFFFFILTLWFESENCILHNVQCTHKHQMQIHPFSCYYSININSPQNEFSFCYTFRIITRFSQFSFHTKLIKYIHEAHKMCEVTAAKAASNTAHYVQTSRVVSPTAHHHHSQQNKQVQYCWIYISIYT